jgi:hypothetical protein
LKRSRFFILLAIFISGSSCNLGPVKDEVPVARAYDNYLYKSELDKVIPVTASATDSAKIAEKYINNWLHYNVLIGQAELNLSNDQLDFEEKLIQYRNSLLIYAYEQALVDEKLQVDVAFLSIINYYNDNRENFILREPAFKLRYIKLYKDSKELDQVEKWIRSDKEEEIEELLYYCENNVAKYFLNDSIWITPKEIKKELPENILIDFKKPVRGFKKTSDDLFAYLVFVKEILEVGDQAPVDLVKEDIISIIINKRKMELLKKMRKDIYSDAVRKNKIELFHN